MDQLDQMDRRTVLKLISYLSLVAGCGSAAESSPPASDVTAAEVHALIESRLAERDVDYVSVLERNPHILSRDPELARKVRTALQEHPEYARLLDDWRIKGLQRLDAADLEPKVKRVMLDLYLEKVLHEVATCLDHFLGVHELLRRWGHRDDVAHIGLFHAVYGTEFNPVQLLDHDSPADRRRIRDAVGLTAEQRVYDFATADTNDFLGQVQSTGAAAKTLRDFAAPALTRPLPHADFLALAETLVANSFEPYVALDGDASALSRLTQFIPLYPFLSNGAKAAVDLSPRP